MHIKATIVAYAFSVQCYENATIVAYAGLRVKETCILLESLFNAKLNGLCPNSVYKSVYSYDHTIKYM